MKDVNRVNDPYLWVLKKVIHISLKALAALMILVVISGVLDVAWTLYQRLVSPPQFILTMNDILATFGAFMTVLIAIEIFVNITVYLRDDFIHVKIVMATAIMAVARKVIILDIKELEPAYLWGVASLMIAVSAGYWLVMKLPRFDLDKEHPPTQKTAEESQGSLQEPESQG